MLGFFSLGVVKNEPLGTPPKRLDTNANAP